MLFFDAFGNYKIIENFSDNKTRSNQLYLTLQSEHWKNIFPDSNRNSGGVQFFNYILKEIKPNKQDFDIYNKLYCGVSGSLISPNNSNAADLVKIKHINGGFICGNYYRCCWPCSCDIMNENLDILAEDVDLELADGTFSYTLLTMSDPCVNSITYQNNEVLPDPENKTEPWIEVSSFKCENKQTKNGFRTPNNRLVFAVLFNTFKCDDQQYEDNSNYDKLLNERCVQRKDPQNNLSNWGMGDIFVNLTKK